MEFRVKAGTLVFWSSGVESQVNTELSPLKVLTTLERHVASRRLANTTVIQWPQLPQSDHRYLRGTTTALMTTDASERPQLSHDHNFFRSPQLSQ